MLVYLSRGHWLVEIGGLSTGYTSQVKRSITVVFGVVG